MQKSFPELAYANKKKQPCRLRHLLYWPLQQVFVYISLPHRPASWVEPPRSRISPRALHL